MPAPLFALVLATALPPLIAYNLTPAATLFNQLLALAGWGGVVAWHASKGLGRVRTSAAAWGLSLLLLVALTSPGLNDLPWSMALSSAALLGGGLLVLLWSQSLGGDGRLAAMRSLCWGLVLGGVLSLGVALVQVFQPSWADGVWIARSGIPGRAVGNMRQPNHLASWLMWAAVAAVFLAEAGRVRDAGRRTEVLRATGLAVLMLGFVLAIVLSASRTGMVGVLLLAVWGAVDRQLSRPSRWVLWVTPLMLAFSWWLLSLWASSGHEFGAGSRLAAEGAGSPSRMAILANAWALLKMHPWTGVGWGEFNLAWSMTPFPDRPVAFFDHCHNLPLQLLVELGWPLGLLVLGLLAASVWRVAQSAWRAQGESALLLRTGLMLVLTIGLHSMLEYPLWYAYFLLPALCALGLCLGHSRPQDGPSGPVSTMPMPSMAGRTLALGGALLVLACAHARWDYDKVVAIYAPPKGAAPLAERIAEGQRSPWFSLAADYAAATTLPPGEDALRAAQRTGHHLIDTRLMMAWARSLHAVGQTDQARHLVQRLREFRNPAASDWLAQCDAVPPGGVAPFQCEPAQQRYDYKVFRR